MQITANKKTTSPVSGSIHTAHVLGGVEAHGHWLSIYVNGTKKTYLHLEQVMNKPGAFRSPIAISAGDVIIAKIADGQDKEVGKNVFVDLGGEFADAVAPAEDDVEDVAGQTDDL